MLNYVKDELKIEYFELMVETTINHEDGLGAVWTSVPGGLNTSTIYSKAGDGRRFTNQAAKCFVDRCEMWIVEESGGTLKASESLRDLWHQAVDLPRYQDISQRDIRTSILLPLVAGRRCCGAVLFETEEYVEPTGVAKQELRRIVGCLGDLFLLNNTYNKQRKNTVSALDGLSRLQQAGDFQNLKKPFVFLAFPGKADTAVVDAINHVVEEYSAYLNFVRWDRISSAGSITVDLLRRVGEARYGICYFSEPSEPGKFIDNINVVFEAGMLQSLTNSPNAQPEGWIPIRERASPAMPFDFAQERTVQVPRDQDGRLTSNALKGSSVCG